MRYAWHLVPSGSTVRGHDQYEWQVRSVGRPDPGAPRGSVKVVMWREGRGEIIGHPPAGAEIDVLSIPPDATPSVQLADVAPERAAVETIRGTLGPVEIVECAWCSGDPGAECLCDVNCGKQGCVNF